MHYTNKTSSLHVRYGADPPSISDPGAWRAPSDAVIERYPWAPDGYTPRVEVRIYRSENFLSLHFKAYERVIRARCTSFQDPVYEDSCVEFFFDPFPDRGIGYVNIEANALGTMLIGLGPERSGRRPLSRDEIAGFEVASSVSAPLEGEHGSDAWWVSYRIPAAFFERLYGERIRSGITGRGNFYKCGDAASPPHYGCWAPIRHPYPDFHLPRFFGLLTFE